MRIISVVFAALTAFLALPQIAAAQAMAAPVEQTVLVPTSAWLVGPSTLAADDSGPLPCIMVNQFNNGFALRISGGDNEVFGMVLDVRQNIFEPGKDYSLPVTIEPDFSTRLKAQAFDSATLMINTQDVKGLFKALEDTRMMTITLGGQELQFVMLGARDGLRRVNACFSGGAADDTAPRQASGQEPEPAPTPALGMHEAGKTGGVAEAYRKLMERGKVEENPDSEAPSAQDAATLEPSSGQTMPPVTTQSAAASVNAQTMLGDSADIVEAPAPLSGGDAKMAAMLERAARRIAGPPPTLMPNLPGNGIKNPAPIRTVTPGQTAPAAAQVATPSVPAVYTGAQLAQNWVQQSAVAAPQAPAKPSAASVTTQQVPRTTPVPYTTIAASPPPDSAATPRRQWNAGAGQNLKQVLADWSQTAHVRLDWLAGRSAPLPAPVSAKGSYEGAVKQALDQFRSGDGAVVGQLYYDKEKGERVLIVTPK